MGIRFRCQACANKVNVKDFLAGKRGICPKCGAKFTIPERSEPEFLSTSDEADDPSPASTNPSPAAMPTASNSPHVATTSQQPLGTMPVAAPIVTAATPGHSPSLNTTQAYAAPQFPTQQPAISQPILSHAAPLQQPAAPFQPAMPAPGFPAAAAPAPHGPRDPFMEAPAAQWYVRHASGQQYGPAPGPTMQKWLAEGRVPGDGMVWREGWADWLVASLVFPQLSAPPVPVPRGPIAAPFAPQPGMFPGPSAPAPAAANDPFSFAAAPSAGTTNTASQLVFQRRDNSKMMFVISIVLLFAIAIVGGVLWYVLTKDNDEGEEVARRAVPARVSVLHLQPDA
jgi:hypothetical protein